jgi:hypothetical protein
MHGTNQFIYFMCALKTIINSKETLPHWWRNWCFSMKRGLFFFLWLVLRHLGSDDVVWQAVVPTLSLRFSISLYFLKGGIVYLSYDMCQPSIFIMRSCDLPANFRFFV